MCFKIAENWLKLLHPIWLHNFQMQRLKINWISICLTDRLCKVEIETDAFRINRRNPKDKVLNLLLSAGTVGAIVIFPGITPFVMSGIAGAGIVAIANSMETKLFRFIKDYINA